MTALGIRRRHGFRAPLKRKATDGRDLLLMPGSAEGVIQWVQRHDGMAITWASASRDGLRQWRERGKGRGSALIPPRDTPGPLIISFASQVDIDWQCHRSIGKSALMFASRLLGNRVMLGQEFARMREIVGSPNSLSRLIQMDYRFDPLTRHGSADHGLWMVACPETGIVAVRVEIYHAFRFSVLLAERWEGPAHGIWHCEEDPIGDKQASGILRLSCNHPLPFLWSITQRFDLSAQVSRFAAEIAELNCTVLPQWSETGVEAVVVESDGLTHKALARK